MGDGGSITELVTFTNPPSPCEEMAVPSFPDSLRQAGVHEADYTAICKKIAEGGITAGTQTLVFRLRHSIEGPGSSPE